jgi:hypothetical protein
MMNTTLHLDTQRSLVQGPPAASSTQLNQPGEERTAGGAADLDIQVQLPEERPVGVQVCCATRCSHLVG